jgi:hypothetical protein
MSAGLMGSGVEGVIVATGESLPRPRPLPLRPPRAVRPLPLPLSGASSARDKYMQIIVYGTPESNDLSVFDLLPQG